MNWDQFKDPLCYMCLHGAVVSSLSLMQEVVGSALTLITKMFYKCCWFRRFYTIHFEKTRIRSLLLIGNPPCYLCIYAIDKTKRIFLFCLRIKRTGKCSKYNFSVLFFTIFPKPYEFWGLFESFTLFGNFWIPVKLTLYVLLYIFRERNYTSNIPYRMLFVLKVK